jgi:hypothetical protein
VSFFCRALADERDRLDELLPLLDDLDLLLDDPRPLLDLLDLLEERLLVDLDLDLGLELWAAMSPPGG